MKRTLAMILSMLLLLGIFASGASAADAPQLPDAPSGVIQQLMNQALQRVSLFSPGWGDDMMDSLIHYCNLIPAPFNWPLVWFVRAYLENAA